MSLAKNGDDKPLTSLECEMCLNTMAVAKMLNCQHYYCVNCMNRVIKTNQQRLTGAYCPACCLFTPESEIQTISSANDKLEAEKMPENLHHLEGDFKTCMQCDQPNPSSLCIQCHSELCDKCTERHLRFPMMRNHTIIRKNGMDVVRDTSAQTETCNRKSISSVKKSLNFMLERASGYLQILNNRQTVIQSRLYQIAEFKQQLAHLCDHTKKAVEEHANVMMLKLNDDLEILMKLVDTSSAAKTKELDLAQTSLEKQFQNQKDLLCSLNKVLGMTNEKEQIRQFEDGLFQNMEDCVQNPAVKSFSMDLKPCFIPNELTLTTNVLGEVTFDGQQGDNYAEIIPGVLEDDREDKGEEDGTSFTSNDTSQTKIAVLPDCN